MWLVISSDFLKLKDFSQAVVFTVNVVISCKQCKTVIVTIGSGVWSIKLWQLVYVFIWLDGPVRSPGL